MLFEVGIPNLVHRCIVCVCHVPILGHCDLYLVIRLIVATKPICVTLTLTLTSGIISRFFVCVWCIHISYIADNCSQMCLMLDQFP